MQNVKKNQNLIKKLICCFKNDTNLVNLTRALESLKVYYDSPKKVILHGTEEWWKFEEKLSYGLENDEEFSKF